MRTSLFLALVSMLCLAGSGRADKIGPPESYKVKSADGKFVFVMLAPDPDRDDGKALRDTYKQSGLYKTGAKEPLWTVDWYRRSAALASDGVHVVRIAGPHSYEERLNPDRSKRMLTKNDLKKESLAIFAKGKLVKEFTIGDFVDDVKTLPKSVTFFRWSKQIRIDDDKKRLEVVTLEGEQHPSRTGDGKDPLEEEGRMSSAADLLEEVQREQSGTESDPTRNTRPDN